MLRLIVLTVALALWAGSAQAQFASACSSVQSAWNRASASNDVPRMQHVAGSIPNVCSELQHVAAQRIAQAQAQYRQQQRQRDQQRRQQQHDIGGGDDDQVAGPPPAVLATPAPTGPVDPCSVIGVEQRFPHVPAILDFTSIGRRDHAGLSSGYVERGDAFLDCKDQAHALADYIDAEKLDPTDFRAFAAQGDLLLGNADFAGAIAAYSSAVAVKDSASPDDNVLTVYAGRATSEAALQRYAEEIGDLQFVTANYRNYNDAQKDDLEVPAYYHEMLGKALYRTHADDAAAQELQFVDAAHLDWEDLRFLAGRQAAARSWAAAIDTLAKAIAAASGDPDLKQKVAQMDVEIGRAYQGRGGDGDPRAAWDAYHRALLADPGNQDAAAALTRLGRVLPPPTFREPALRDVVMPEGVADLAQDTPPPFCDQPAKNDYLNTVNAATEAVNANIGIIADDSARLLDLWKVYDGATLLTYQEKVDDEAIIDRERARLHDESVRLNAEGLALGAFFARISDERGDVRGGCHGHGAGG
jgi:tetratricopeptide (TPR) repeat protein